MTPTPHRLAATAALAAVVTALVAAAVLRDDDPVSSEERGGPAARRVRVVIAVVDGDGREVNGAAVTAHPAVRTGFNADVVVSATAASTPGTYSVEVPAGGEWVVAATAAQGTGSTVVDAGRQEPRARVTLK